MGDNRARTTQVQSTQDVANISHRPGYFTHLCKGPHATHLEISDNRQTKQPPRVSGGELRLPGTGQERTQKAAFLRLQALPGNVEVSSRSLDTHTALRLGNKTL